MLSVKTESSIYKLLECNRNFMRYNLKSYHILYYTSTLQVYYNPYLTTSTVIESLHSTSNFNKILTHKESIIFNYSF